MEAGWQARPERRYHVLYMILKHSFHGAVEPHSNVRVNSLAAQFREGQRPQLLHVTTVELSQGQPSQLAIIISSVTNRYQSLFQTTDEITRLPYIITLRVVDAEVEHSSARQAPSHSHSSNWSLSVPLSDLSRSLSLTMSSLSRVSRKCTGKEIVRRVCLVY